MSPFGKIDFHCCTVVETTGASVFGPRPVPMTGCRRCVSASSRMYWIGVQPPSVILLKRQP
jgi:hypothetical protein